MSEPTNLRELSESLLGEEVLVYGDGWREILTDETPEAEPLHNFLGLLIEATLSVKEQHEELLHANEKDVLLAWLRLIEKAVPKVVIIDEPLAADEIVETALITIEINLNNLGWHKEGVGLIIPDMNTGRAAYDTVLSYLPDRGNS